MGDQGVIEEFGGLIHNELQEFINASQQLGEPMFALANMVKRAFNNLLQFITDGVRMERPDEAELRRMINLLATEIADIQTFRDRNRQIQEVFNHLSTVSESVVALSWITVSNNPAQFVHDMRDAGQYFGNRVLSQYRGQQQHQDWINKWNTVLLCLENYVKLYHRTGFQWNRLRGHQFTRPGDSEVRGPPPPPPPPRNIDLNPECGDIRQSLLRDINQGVGIVRMLRPINREQPSQSQQSLPSTSGENIPRIPVAERTYPPKFLLDGQKWRVEHQKDRYDLVIENAEMNHSLAIFKCQNSGLEVRNKLNGVTIDSCKRTTVVLKDIISAVELIGCSYVKVQCTGHVPIISIDNCDSVEIFLTDNSIDAEIVSSKSTSLNVSVMKPNGEYVELPVPEQIKSIVVDEKLVSSVVNKY